MYDSGQNNMATNLSQNIPNASLMMLMLSPVFGNAAFMVTPASPDPIQRGYPTVPYLSLEAVIYNQNSSNPMVATQNLMTGSTSGTQNVAGSITTTDPTGNVRVSIGSGGGY